MEISAFGRDDQPELWLAALPRAMKSALGKAPHEKRPDEKRPMKSGP